MRIGNLNLLSYRTEHQPSCVAHHQDETTSESNVGMVYITGHNLGTISKKGYPALWCKWSGCSSQWPADRRALPHYARQL